jgi:hypothetical protein
MYRTLRVASVSLVAVALWSTTSSSASAQRRGFTRLFGVITSVQLAQLDEVQAELKLTDEQKGKVTTLNTDLSDERRAAREDANGDFDKMFKEIALLNAEFTKEFNELLDETQRKRAHEIYLQANGAVALTDDAVAESLKVTDEQKTKLQQSLADSRGKARDSFQDFQSLSETERDAKVAEMIKSRDDGLFAVLEDAQKKQFEEMQGAKLEIDLSKLPGPGR